MTTRVRIPGRAGRGAIGFSAEVSGRYLNLVMEIVLLGISFLYHLCGQDVTPRRFEQLEVVPALIDPSG
jgi:hypothetical protein